MRLQIFISFQSMKVMQQSRELIKMPRRSSCIGWGADDARRLLFKAANKTNVCHPPPRSTAERVRLPASWCWPYERRSPFSCSFSWRNRTRIWRSSSTSPPSLFSGIQRRPGTRTRIIFRISVAPTLFRAIRTGTLSCSRAEYSPSVCSRMMIMSTFECLDLIPGKLFTWTTFAYKSSDRLSFMLSVSSSPEWLWSGVVRIPWKVFVAITV